MKIACLYTCNPWKEYASMRLVGVFTNPRKLLAAVARLIAEGDVENTSGLPLADLDLDRLGGALNCAHVEWIEENTLNGEAVSEEWADEPSEGDAP